ncbi:DNA oxidative demethylase AlkB [uncultured Rhodoferax sp.]|uniref:DNA oxidative demethylase AlkB n=1 Tax=uncultured Rhodoferax sp. TaxID=223188 RepID=UPI0025DACCB3|nr:DNA oxidative demethylase AlkB [uncultured Rhodoferax sp.]
MDLFDDLPLAAEDLRTAIAPGAVLLRGLGRADDAQLLAAAESVIAQLPLRHLHTPGGYTMSIQTTRCGSMGWTSEPGGYRYAAANPQTRQPWPAMPQCLMDFAVCAAAQAGYPGFVPDSCLINQYLPGNKLGLHQDRDERDLRAPVVSLSLGLPATFLFGGLQRSGKTQRFRLAHGDVVVWGGPSRLAFHGVLPVADGDHPLVGRRRINLTFRKVA